MRGREGIINGYFFFVEAGVLGDVAVVIPQSDISINLPYSFEIFVC